jgi:hypothetical protein
MSKKQTSLLALVLAVSLIVSASAQTQINPKADFNGDGVIDIRDVSALSAYVEANYGATVNNSTPAPTTLPATATLAPTTQPTSTPTTVPNASITFRGVTAGTAHSGTLGIEAVVSGVQPASVVFGLNGASTQVWTERIPPFYFFGDAGGTPNGWDTTQWPNGSYSLSAVAYDAEGRQISPPSTIMFSILNAAPATVAPTNTPAPTNIPTNTPVPATATPIPATATPSAGVNAPDFTRGDFSGALGMSRAVYDRMRADAASGLFDRPCTDAEHDRTQWHGLLNYANDKQPGSGCYFDHFHGDNPNAVNDLFGAPAAWWGGSQEIAYPWQTFTVTVQQSQNDLVQLPAGHLRENEYKHEGYLWIVRRGQTCAQPGPCATDFRLQVHYMNAHDGPVRFHSFSSEVRLCFDAPNNQQCGIRRAAGWMDFGKLTVQREGDVSNPACWFRFNQTVSNGTNTTQLVTLPDDQKFYDQFRSDDPPFDEVRCHATVPVSFIAANPNGFSNPNESTLAEWWGHTKGQDFRAIIFNANPTSNVSPQTGMAMQPYCPADSATCRWTGGRIAVRLGYVVPVNESTDPDRNGIADVRGFATRWGVPTSGCTAPGLDCVPYSFEGVRLPTASIGYQPNRETGSPLDHDITPAGQPSWVTWFRHTH